MKDGDVLGAVGVGADVVGNRYTTFARELLCLFIVNTIDGTSSRFQAPACSLPVCWGGSYALESLKPSTATRRWRSATCLLEVCDALC